MKQSWKFAALLAMCTALSFVVALQFPLGRQGPAPPTISDVVMVTGDLFNLSWYIEDVDARRLAAKSVTISAQIKTSVGQKFGLQIFDGIGDGRSTLHAGDGKWQTLSATHVIGPNSTLVRLRFVYARQQKVDHDVFIKDVRATVGGDPLFVDDSALLDGARGERLMANWKWDGGTGKIRVVSTTN